MALSAIAINCSLKRSESLPNVPTVAEAGYPGFEERSWVGFFAPAKTPAVIVERLNREINAVLKDAPVEKKLRSMQFAIQGGSLKDARDYVNLQYTTWGKVVKEIGVKPQ